MTTAADGMMFPGAAAPEKAGNGSRRRFKIRRAHRSGRRRARKREPVAKRPDGEEKPIEISLSFSSSSSENDGVVVGEEEDGAREKRSERSINHGSLSVIGRRREMEDAVRVELGFAKRLKAGEVYDFFGVYDGHGGARVAEACRERLHRLVAEELEGLDQEAGWEMDWKGTMVGCFEKMDGEVTGGGAAEEMNTVGSTAVVAVVGREVVVAANCGDSRAVLCRGGVAMALTDDHKPNRPDELKRVEAAGGRVINWNGHRILGVLSTSRSIGDQYMKPFVIPEPEINVSRRTDADEFLILASDGLWDVVSNEFACQVVRQCLAGRMRRRTREGDAIKNRAAEAAAMLAELAMARGSKDNISVIVVELAGPS
ncbi:probable protein phosphatase 2C 8 [Syzygium oleosum]|uniref:probable protein phosphatase 2C 8 n=1 Tax=Syzygium oleosum TaxID=219896 RepID=UPI0011D17FA5|nr:probable protein phosphatase 2C 8 [Syzygium oleosum]